MKTILPFTFKRAGNLFGSNNRNNLSTVSSLAFFFAILCISFSGKAQSCNCDYTVPLTTGVVDRNSIPESIFPKNKRVICLPAGVRGRLIFRNFKGSTDGDINSPYKIINCGGVAKFTGSGSVPNLINFTGSENFQLTGTGSSAHTYGIVLEGGHWGLALSEFTERFEVDHVQISKTDFAAVEAKTNNGAGSAGNASSNAWVMRNIKFHHNYIFETGAEGLYIGHTSWRYNNEQHNIDGCDVYENIFRDTKAEAIQVGATYNGKGNIYNNKITNYGVSPFGNYQSNGIQLSSGFSGKVYNNLIIAHPTVQTGNGIISGGVGNVYIFNNVIANAKGYGIYAKSDGVRGKTWPFYVVNNTFINPVESAIRFADTDGISNVFSLHIYNNIITDKTEANAIQISPTATISKSNNVFAPLASFKFLNPANREYKLTAQSTIAIDKGLNVQQYSVTTDIEGKPRTGPTAGTAYDVGAYEYQTSLVQYTITTGTVSPTSVAPGGSITVNFTRSNVTWPAVTYKALLSQADGTFAVQPTVIGSTTIYNGTIAATIPSSATAGTNYKVRVDAYEGTTIRAQGTVSSLTLSITSTPPPPTCNCDYTITKDMEDVNRTKINVPMNKRIFCVEAGVRKNKRLILSNFKGSTDGDVSSPYIFINCGGQVKYVVDTFWIDDEGDEQTLPNILNIRNSENFRFTGTGSPAHGFGFYLDGGHWTGSLSSKTERFEFDHVLITNSNFAGLGAKSNDVNSNLEAGIKDPNAWVMHNVKIHHNHVSKTKAEGFYIGNTSWADEHGNDQHNIDGLDVYDNYFQDIGAEAIQVGATFNGNARINNNGVIGFGRNQHDFAGWQNNGIQLSSGFSGKVYNNYVYAYPQDMLTANGITGLGVGKVYIYNNIVMNAKGHGIYSGAKGSEGPDWPFYITNNTIINPGDDAIRFLVQSGYANKVTAYVYNNLVTDLKAGQVLINKDAGVTVHHSNNISGSTASFNFVDPGNNNYRLTSASTLALNKGINTTAYGVTTDFDNKPRAGQGSAYDVGAFEYQFTVQNSRLISDLGDSENDAKVMAYPNPFNGSTTLTLKGLKDSKSIISIYNSRGKLVYRKEANSAEGLDVGNDLTPGVYMITISEMDKSKSLRIIKY